MLNKRMFIVPALAIAVAASGSVYAVGTAAKPASKPAPKAAPAKPATAKATQEANLKKVLASPNTTVVATVGSETITKGDLDKIMWEWNAPLTLDEYINYRVVMQAVKKAGLSVTQADIDAKISEIKKTQLAPGETLDAKLQQIKMPMARFRGFLSSQIGIEKLADKKITVGDKELADFAKAKHILLRTPSTNDPNSTPEDKTAKEAEIKAKIEKIAADIKSGKITFDEAAKQSSEDPGSKDKGGQLGWFRKADMVPEFSEAAFALKPGEISGPVKSFFGYHLIFLEKTGKTASTEEKMDIVKMVRDRERPKLIRSIGEQLRKDAKINNVISPQLPETGMGMARPTGED